MQSRRVIQLGIVAAVIVTGLVYTALTILPQAPLQQVESDVFKEVWFVPDQEATDVTVHLIFDRGEMDHTYTEGLAHYVEHLAWLSVFRDDEGARHANAWTSISATGYWRTASVDAFPDVVAQLVKVTEPFTLDTEFMLEERDIVLREYELRVSDWPLYPVYDDVARVLYDNGPLARSVIGKFDEIPQYSLADARQLHAESHKLRNATLFVSGPLGVRDVRAAIADLVADGTGSDRIAQGLDTTPFRDEQAIAVPGVTQPSLIYRKVVPLENCEFTARCDYILAVLQNALDSTLDGGLAGPLRFDNFIAESFSFSFSRPNETHVEIGFVAVPDRGVELDTLLASFEAALSDTIDSGLPPETFARTKARLVSDVAQWEDDPDFLADLVGELISAGWPVYDWDAARDAVAAVTQEDIAAVLQQMATPGRVVIRKVSVEND